MIQQDKTLFYREQHKHRLNYMPWLYYSLKDKHKQWAEEWQIEYQHYLMQVETIHIGKNCFISPLAHIFAERGRDIYIGDNSFIAGDCFLHGPLNIGAEVAINHHCILDGGRAGIIIHDQVRIGAYSHLYAFNHGMDIQRPIYQQANTSQGIEIEQDVWLGSHVGVRDGVKIGKQAIIGMDSMVTKNVESRAVMVGNPARFVRWRS